MLHVNSRETTFEHHCVPAARFKNIFLKLFDRHVSLRASSPILASEANRRACSQAIDMLPYCDIQVDLKSFLGRERSFLGREATVRATISKVINSRHSSFLTVSQETNTSKSPGWVT